MNKIRFVIAGIVLVLLGFLHFSGLDNNFLNYIEVNKFIWLNYVRNNYLFSVLVFALVYMAASVFLSVMTLPLTMIGGFLFGVVTGAFYSVVISTLGVMITFLFFRYLVGKSVHQKYSLKTRKLNQNLKKFGAIYVLILRVLIFLPFFLITILCSFSNISLFTMIWTTVLGILPATVVYSYVGNQVGTVTSVADIFNTKAVLLYVTLASIILVPAIIIIYFINKNRLKEYREFDK